MVEMSCMSVGAVETTKNIICKDALDGFEQEERSTKYTCGRLLEEVETNSLNGPSCFDCHCPLGYTVKQNTDHAMKATRINSSYSPSSTF